MYSRNSKLFVTKKNRHEIEDVILHNPLKNKSNHQAAFPFEFDRRWFDFMWIFIALTLILLIARVFYLSIIQHENHAFSAHGNITRQTPVIATRGMIFAKDGEILAQNEPNYSLILRTKNLDSNENLEENIKWIAQFFAISEESLNISIKDAKKNGGDMILKEQISLEKTIAYRAGNKIIPGFTIEKNASRIYPNGEIFAHLIGYEGLIRKEDFTNKKSKGYLLTDRIGKTGLEKHYESTLRGTHGYEKKIVDSLERTTRIFEKKEAIPGDDIYTHIDADLQKNLTKRLVEELERAKSKRAAAVAIDPRSGAVRAFVSLPHYDNNAFVHGIDSTLYSTWISDEDQPLFNRALAGVYPPGSTVKPVMGIATLMEKIVDASYQIESRGGITVGSSFFGDWKVHGFTDLSRAIAVSSDVYFYTIGGGYGNIKGLGIDRMAKWMKTFGYGEKTGIDLPNEASGIYPTKEYKQDIVGERWYVGDTYNTSIGQGFVSSTPLQVANSIAAIANGGTLYKPRVVDYFKDTNGKQEFISPAILRSNLASQDAIIKVQKGMRKTVTEGTGRLLQNLAVPVAGKTGTAQFYGEDEKVHSWFVAYAPYEKPEIVLLVLIEGQSGKISSATLPVARDVLETYFEVNKDR